MANKATIVVRTPITTDGTTLAYDENKQPIYKETTLPASARKHFESLNANLPEHLRHEFGAAPKSKKTTEVAPAATAGKGKGKSTSSQLEGDVVTGGE